jgi:hypothetical protein
MAPVRRGTPRRIDQPVVPQAIGDLLVANTFAVVLDEDVGQLAGSDLPVAFAGLAGEDAARREPVPAQGGSVLGNVPGAAVGAKVVDLGTLMLPAPQLATTLPMGT